MISCMSQSMGMVVFEFCKAPDAADTARVADAASVSDAAAT